MPWILLVLAGLAEVAFAFCLGKARVASGAEATGWYAGFGGGAVLSFYLLNLSLAHITLGTACAVWTASGRWERRWLAWSPLATRSPGRACFFLLTLIGSGLGLKAVVP